MNMSEHYSPPKQTGYDGYPELIRLCLDLTHGMRLVRFWLYPGCDIGGQPRHERLANLAEGIRRKL